MPVMDRGSTDEAVVTVKLDADDAVVMQLRVKHPASGKEAGGEGRNMTVFTVSCYRLSA
jgi:hypothetical protein